MNDSTSSLLNQNSSDSNSSEISQLCRTRAQLLSEKKSLKRDIHKSQIAIDGYEHDLRLAKEAYTFTESKILDRTRKLATLFGRHIQNDDQLIELIRSLMAEVKSKEAEVVELKSQIEKINVIHTEDETEKQKLQNFLEEKKGNVHNSYSKLTQLQSELESINSALFNAQKQRTFFYQSIAPISISLGIKENEYDDKYFEKLRKKSTAFQSDVISEFLPLSQLTQIPIDFSNFNPINYLEQTLNYYQRLIQYNNEQKTLNDSVQAKILKVKRRIQKENSKHETLLQEIQDTNNNFDSIKEIISQRKIKAKDEITSKVAKLREHEIQLYSQDLPRDKLTSNPDQLLQQQINRLQSTVQQLVQERANLEARKMSPEYCLIREIDAIDNAANALSRANRRLMKNLK